MPRLERECSRVYACKAGRSDNGQLPFDTVPRRLVTAVKIHRPAVDQPVRGVDILGVRGYTDVAGEQAVRAPLVVEVRGDLQR
jgi:hypothetical protein